MHQSLKEVPLGTPYLTYFDGLGRLAKEYQSHQGAVDTGTTPHVDYAYDTAASGGVYSHAARAVSVDYPSSTDGVSYDYGSAGGLDDTLSRLAAIRDNNSGSDLAVYSYNGAGRLVKETYKSAADGDTVAALDYHQGTTGVYAGFDRFGRVVDQRWNNAAGSAIDEHKYGYDWNSNRLWRQNMVKTDGLDWQSRMDCGLFAPDQRRAWLKLVSYWGRLGFQRIPGTRCLALQPSSRRPAAEEVMLKLE